MRTLLQFCYSLPIPEGVSAEQIYRDYRPLLDTLQTEGEEQPGLPGIRLVADRDWLFIVADGDRGNPDAAATLISYHLKRFGMTDEELFQWCEYATVLNPGCFFGGAMIVTADGYRELSFYDMMEEAQK